MTLYAKGGTPGEWGGAEFFYFSLMHAHALIFPRKGALFVTSERIVFP